MPLNQVEKQVIQLCEAGVTAICIGPLCNFIDVAYRFGV